MTFAETLSDQERRRGRRYAFLACLFGCVSEVMLDSSAIIIIFFTMINGGDMLTMLGTSFTGVMGALLYIPASSINNRLGRKKVVHYSCILGCFGFLLMASAPCFGAGAKYVALIGCLIYCLQRSSYGAAWYPLLDVFLRPQDRGKFFGMMRFLYTCFIGIVFFLIGLVMQHEPPMIFIQLVIAGAGLLLLGRDYCIFRFPDNPDEIPETPDIKKGLSISMKNGPLTSYSVYLGLLTIAYTSLIPLTYLYLKQFVRMNSGTVQIISAVGSLGMMTGYLCYNRFFDKLSLKCLELMAHSIFMFSAFALFFMDKSMPGFAVVTGFVVFALSFGYSVYMCNNSAELLALARPGNKTMAMAFIQTYSSGGAAIGRISLSLVLGTTMLSPVWDFYGRTVCHYQTIFLICGVLLFILYFLLPTLPSFVPAHDDYYEPKN